MVIRIRKRGSYDWCCEDCGKVRTELPHRGPRKKVLQALLERSLSNCPLAFGGSSSAAGKPRQHATPSVPHRARTEPVNTERPAAPAEEWESPTHRFSLAGHKVYVTVASDEHGRPVHLEIRMSRAGGVLRGLSAPRSACSAEFRSPPMSTDWRWRDSSRPAGRRPNSATRTPSWITSSDGSAYGSREPEPSNSPPTRPTVKRAGCAAIL